MKKAAIVLPTYNEAGNIEEVIEGIFKQQHRLERWELEILVVDSQSQDDTVALVKKLQKKHTKLHLLETQKEGLGKAYTQGFMYAIDHLQPFVIFEMDADGQHNPEDIPQFLKKIEEGSDFVIGSRYIKGGAIPANWGIMRKIYSIPGNLIIRLGFMKLSIHDWTNGFRAIKTFIIKDALNHLSNYSGYVFQIALLDFAIKGKARISEIPIIFKDRKKGESKISASGYSSQILLYIFQHSSFVKFSLVGAIGFILDFGISFILIEKINFPIWIATVISTETAILMNFVLNNFWSFSHKKVDHSMRAYFNGLLKFNLVSSGSILIQSLGVHYASVIFGESYWYIYKVLIIVFIVLPYSYFFYNKVIWTGKK